MFLCLLRCWKLRLLFHKVVYFFLLGDYNLEIMVNTANGRGCDIISVVQKLDSYRNADGTEIYSINNV